MKRTILCIAVAMLVLLATITAPVTAQTDTEKDRVITTSATSEVPVTPDRAQISIGVQTQM